MNDGVYKPLTENLDEIFKPSAWLNTVALINKFIFKNNVLISIVGEKGSGKTTFIRLLQDKLDSAISSCLITASRKFNREDFLNNLANSLAVEKAENMSMVAHEINERKTQVMLIIDDAHWLPESILTELLDSLLIPNNNLYFHICLLSDYSLVEVTSRLAATDYNELIHSIELGALSEDETKEFVLSHLPSTIDTTSEVINDRIKRFYELTEGKVFSVNPQMLSFLGSSRSPMLKTKKKSWLPYAGIAATALFSTIFTYILYSPEGKVEQTVALLAPTPKIEVAVVENEEDFISKVPAHTDLAKRQLMYKNPMVQVVETTDEESVDESLVVMDSVVPVPKVMPKAVENKKFKKKAIVAKAPLAVQILAADSMQKLEQFIKEHHLQGKAKIKIAQNTDKDWYVLTVGEFSKFQDAKHMLNSLPQDIQKQHPWIRATSKLRSIN